MRRRSFRMNWTLLSGTLALGAVAYSVLKRAKPRKTLSPSSPVALSATENTFTGTADSHSYAHPLRGLSQEKSRREDSPGFGEHYQNDRTFGENRHGESPIPVVANSIRPDRVIRSEIRELLEKDPGIDERLIRVAVRNGIVRLSGKVRDESMRETAEFLLGAVPGILELRNEIRSVRAG